MHLPTVVGIGQRPEFSSPNLFPIEWKKKYVGEKHSNSIYDAKNSKIT